MGIAKLQKAFLKTETSFPYKIMQVFHHFYSNELEHFETNSTDNHSSGGGNGRNDLSGNELDLVSRNFFNAVVSGSQVGNSGDEVNVEVGIIILFEFNSVDLSSSRDLSSYANKTR